MFLARDHIYRRGKKTGVTRNGRSPAAVDEDKGKGGHGKWSEEDSARLRALVASRSGIENVRTTELRDAFPGPTAVCASARPRARACVCVCVWAGGGLLTAAPSAPSALPRSRRLMIPSLPCSHRREDRPRHSGTLAQPRGSQPQDEQRACGGGVVAVYEDGGDTTRCGCMVERRCREGRSVLHARHPQGCLDLRGGRTRRA